MTDKHTHRLGDPVCLPCAIEIVKEGLAEGDISPEQLGFLQSGAWGWLGNLGPNERYVKATYGDYSNEHSTDTPNTTESLVWLWALVKEDK